ncbi:MAG: ABC transporter permease [Fimbriimonadaceae bacterium]
MIDLLAVARFSTPVALAATGETVGQKSGVINVGLEGMMLASSYAAAMLALGTGSSILGLLFGAAVGVTLALIFAWFVIRMGVDQIVVGTAMNLLALGVTATLFRGAYGQSGKLLSLPPLPRWGGMDVLLFFVPVLVLASSWLIYRTRWGLAVRAAGENPIAAEAAGFSVLRLRFGATAVAGLFAGLAGAYLALGVNGSFAENMTAGRGFVAIAMVTFGRWKPIWVLLASLLIGYAESLQFQFQAEGVAVPYQLLVAMPYVLALVVLVVAGKGSAAPSALAKPYRRER